MSGSPIGVTKLVCSCRQKRSLQRLRRDDPLDTSRLNLEGKDYVSTDFSPAFPLLTAKVLEDFFDKSMSMRPPD